MIFSAVTPGEPDMLFTPVEVAGRHVLVGVSAQELFKAALGEKEFNRRCVEAYEKDTGMRAPADVQPKIPTPDPIRPPRFIDLFKGKK